MFPSLTLPVVFAHRGASAHAPENTLAAFRLAAEVGSPAIELDVKLTADKQVVVLHDPTLERTTNGHGRLVDTPLTEVCQLDAGSHFSAQFKDERIPTLAEVFDAVGQKLFINVELTNYETPTDDLVARVVDLVQQHHMENRVMFSSFNPLNLSKARRLAPEIPLGLLMLQGKAGQVIRSLGTHVIPHDAIHPNIHDVTPRLVDSAHRRGRRVHVWTVNNPEEMRRLFQIGVDGIFTDDPVLALQVLAERG